MSHSPHLWQQHSILGAFFSTRGYLKGWLKSFRGQVWVWVKIKPPGIGPQVLVLSISQGKPFGGCQVFDHHSRILAGVFPTHFISGFILFWGEGYEHRQAFWVKIYQKKLCKQGYVAWHPWKQPNLLHVVTEHLDDTGTPSTTWAPPVAFDPGESPGRPAFGLAGRPGLRGVLAFVEVVRRSRAATPPGVAFSGKPEINMAPGMGGSRGFLFFFGGERGGGLICFFLDGWMGKACIPMSIWGVSPFSLEGGGG